MIENKLKLADVTVQW